MIAINLDDYETIKEFADRYGLTGAAIRYQIKNGKLKNTILVAGITLVRKDSDIKIKLFRQKEFKNAK